MKTTKRLFGKESKYSDNFYNRILLRSSLAVLLVFFVLLLFLTGQIVKSNLDTEKHNLATENDECFSTLNDVLKSAQNVTLFFAYYKDFSPLFQAESKLNTRKILLEQEAKTFIACFDYMSGIEVKTPDTTVSITATPDIVYEKIQFSDPFTIYTSSADSYPPLIKISYSSQSSDTFSAEVSLYSEYLSTHYMNENSYLLTADGRILLAQDYTLIGQHFSDVVPIDVKTILNGTSSSEYLYAKQLFLSDRMILVSLAPKSDIYAGIIIHVLMLFLIYCIVSIFCVILLSFLLRKIYRPIKDVAQVLKYYMPENDSLLESDAAFIQNCMKRYHTSQDIDAALIQIRKGQLITLHSQISPHLLGNTLESIKCEIIEQLGFNTKLEQAIGSLSLFLNESYEYQEMITSIDLEIKRTKYYADMMVYCFFERLQIEWEIVDEVRDCAIINLTLQPFIENCIEHGFSHEEPNPKVRIRISTYGESVFIEIEDNGRGMGKDTLSNIRKALSDDRYAHKHIGIKNSHLKLKLLFGDGYGVTDIQSGADGTYIRITIPKMEYNSKYPTH